MNKLSIYIDMDDVVADWKGMARMVLNTQWENEERIPEEQWNKLKQDTRFYRHLPLKEGAKELVQWCVDYSKRNDATVGFLTALPHDYSVPYAAQDKVWWANDHFPGIPVFFGPFSHDKWRHCRPGDILIDDRTSNCNEWINASGGRAFIYRNWPACKQWLETTLGEVI